MFLVRYSNVEDSYSEWYRIVDDEDDFVRLMNDVKELYGEYKYVDVYSLNESFDLE